jgi:hypothetical protein
MCGSVQGMEITEYYAILRTVISIQLVLALLLSATYSVRTRDYFRRTADRRRNRIVHHDLSVLYLYT